MIDPRKRSVWVALWMTAGVIAPQASAAPVEIQVRALSEARAVLTDDARSWTERGFGKTRFGGDGQSSRLLLRGEGAALIQARLPADLTFSTLLSVNSQQHSAVDVIESFVTYKPALTSPTGVRLKAGAFLPPVSLENTGLAWTSPFSINSSAINTWVGEELRAVGAEATVVRKSEDGELSFSIAGFGFNDPVGSLLAWRGWAVHDREAGLFDRLPLPNLRNFARPNGSAPGQTIDIRPGVELDDRVGTYASAAYVGDNGLKLRAMAYDNRANTRVFDGKQYAWRTQFVSVGVAAPLGEEWEFLAQGMTGKTRMAIFPTFTVVDNDFNSVFGLVSYRWDQHRVSLRAEYFDVRDNDFTRDDPNGEHGNAVTLAYVFRPTDDQRITVELMQLNSTRARRAEFGLAPRGTETQVQLSYRFFFSSH